MLGFKTHMRAKVGKRDEVIALTTVMLEKTQSEEFARPMPALMEVAELVSVTRLAPCGPGDKRFMPRFQRHRYEVF